MIKTLFYIQFFDFVFDSGIDFKDAGGPPMLTGPLPDPKTPPNPPKIDFSPGGAVNPVVALATIVVGYRATGRYIANLG